jgi:hypothetical protein
LTIKYRSKKSYRFVFIMKKVFVVMMVAVLAVGFGMSTQNAHAQTAGTPETFSATDLNVLGKTLSVSKTVLDEIQTRLDAHAIPQSSFVTLNATLEGMKGSLLTIRMTLAQSASGSVPVAITQEPASAGVSVENQPVSLTQPVAIVPTENTNAEQQSASIGLIARHPTASLWIGLIVFILIIGILLSARMQSDGDEMEQKPKESAPVVSTGQPEGQ